MAILYPCHLTKCGILYQILRHLKCHFLKGILAKVFEGFVGKHLNLFGHKRPLSSGRPLKRYSLSETLREGVFVLYNYCIVIFL